MVILKIRASIKIVIIIFILSFIVSPILFSNQASAQSFTLKWTCDTNLNAYIGPVTKDINGDGIHEIFLAGRVGDTIQGRIICINGANGNIIWSQDISGCGTIDYHVPCAIADINNDGQYEVVHIAGDHTIARRADNGNIVWNAAIPSGWHQFIIVKLDDSSYPYIYVSDHDDEYPYNAKITKIYGNNGTKVCDTPILYSCYGGVSTADLNNDGNIEILVSDRSSGKGMRCYDEDLNLLWYMDEITCSSHCLMPVDVTGDSSLEVVAMKQSSESGTENGGIYVVDSQGNKITGKCSPNLGLGSHTQPAVYDIDKDGHLELATAFATSVKVWDLTSWTLDFETTEDHISSGPNFANVMGDNDLEMIVCDAWNGRILIFDSQYQLIQTIIKSAYSTMTQDIDEDGLNEMLVLFRYKLYAYDTLASASNPAVRSDCPYYSERRTCAGVYVPPIWQGDSENNPPYEPSNPSPNNGATNQQSTVDLSWTGGDPDEGDSLTYDIYFEKSDSTPDVLVSNDQMGTSFDPGLLEDGQTYYWYIISKDNHGMSATGSTWHFSTIQTVDQTPPQISDVTTRLSNPIDTEVNFGWENITCTVTDNCGVNQVRMNIFYPDGSQSNFSMHQKGSTSQYYYNSTFQQPGNYSYFIWANDTSGNAVLSSGNLFSIAPNWDINNNGIITIFDLVLVSNLISQTGDPGWIREDADNNGYIQILDFILVSNHYRETW